MKDADPTTVIHELFHFLEKTFADDPAFSNLRRLMGSDLEGRERMAALFEAYLYTGKAPRPELQPEFDRLREMMSQVYKGVVNSPIEVEVGKALADQMFRLQNLDSFGPCRFADVEMLDRMAEAHAIITEVTALPCHDLD